MYGTIISMKQVEHSCKISVIVPVYNTAPFLADCFDSMLSQAFSDIELICVDDGSTDDSLSILKEYENTDTRFKVFDIAHGGQSAARNRALREATGKYIYFMDSDDRLADNALETMYNLSEERELDILYFDGAVFTDDESLKDKYSQFSNYYIRPVAYNGVVTGTEMFTRMFADSVYRVSPCLQLIRREYLNSIGFSFFEGIIHEDNISNFECMIQAERVSHENVVLFHRRFREGSTMTEKVTYKNFYGYFICWYKILVLTAGMTLTQETETEIGKLLKDYHSLAIGCCKELSIDEIQENFDKGSPILREVYMSSFKEFIVRERKSKRFFR